MPPQPDGQDRQPPVQSQEKQYLIAKQDVLLPAGITPLDFGGLLEQLDHDPSITVERVLAPQSLSLFANAPTTLQKVIVARMPASKAEQIEAHPQVLLEEDYFLRPVPAPIPSVVDNQDPGIYLPFGTSATWRMRIQDTEGSPQVGATVYLYGGGIPAQGRTDNFGIVELSLLNESDATLRALYVNPQSGSWSLWIDRPGLRSGVENTVVCTPLSQSFPGFPNNAMFGWGQQEMKLDQLPPTMDGAGVRVAVIDSGAAALTHPDLTQINLGIDLTTTPANPQGWTDDTIAHGSHCSGVIAAGNPAVGIRGFAPKAEVHEARIFPGGRISSLLDALDYCITNEIDVVNMSLGTGGSSQLFLQKLAQARAQGVACIVAAGNSGDGVQFPGSSPDVLTVAAIGKQGQFPQNSFHAQQVLPGGRTDGALFAAKFSCHGPEIDVCAPGVAIVSSVPPAGYAAWDGTSMATPHVTGLAALILAHHADFQGPFAARNANRVEHLFKLIKASARPVELGDATRTGAGLPDAVRAFNINQDTIAALPPGQAPAAQAGPVRVQLELLRAAMVAAGIPVAQPASAGPPEVIDLAEGHVVVASTGPGAAGPGVVPAPRGHNGSWFGHQPAQVQAALAKLAADLAAAGVNPGVP